MSVSDEIAILERLEHVHELCKSILQTADDRLLRGILHEISVMELEIWFEQDRRAGHPWAQPSANTSGCRGSVPLRSPCGMG